jgi:hypothetical protein
MDDYKKGMVGYTNSRPVTKPMLPLDDQERDLIAYFFAKLKLTDPRFYSQAMPDEKTEQITKRDYANALRYLTNDQIDNGFNRLRSLMAANHNDYRFLTIPKVIGLCDGTAAVMAQEGVQVGAHKILPPALPEPKEYRSKRYEEGIKQCQDILAMLNPPQEPKQLTQEEIDDNLRLERLKNGK